MAAAAVADLEMVFQLWLRQNFNAPADFGKWTNPCNTYSEELIIWDCKEQLNSQPERNDPASQDESGGWDYFQHLSSHHMYVNSSVPFGAVSWCQ